ncbi:MAG: DUF2303 family protein [Reyranella sp.]|uniref:DUF2303 family protein n=1 Tax=Reyranella sp. TaxID=1929291 RepID=UPI003D148DA9
MKEGELRRFATCSMCGKPIGHTGVPLFSRVTIERFGVDRGTCDHRAVYDCPASEEWKIWTAFNGKARAQPEFARFLEDNLPDVIAPPSADMLRIAMTLQVKKDVNFESDLRLDNGQAQLRYEETIRGTTRNGDLVIPDQFTISIPVFEGTPRVPIQARLRYRLADQKLSMWYDLVRPEVVKREAVQAVTREIAAGLDGFSIYLGRR